jgi:hypothetical protein
MEIRIICKAKNIAQSNHKLELLDKKNPEIKLMKKTPESKRVSLSFLLM